MQACEEGAPRTAYWTWGHVVSAQRMAAHLRGWQERADVDLQMTSPSNAAFAPFGGIKMAEEACQTSGRPDPELQMFAEYSTRTTGGVQLTPDEARTR
ncbi:MAG: hypothetical protein ACLVJ6_17885 [Merdibacter sp.]